MSEKTTLAVQHLNSCVYELAMNAEGETKHLFKQHNNVIPVIGTVIERRHNVSFNELKEQVQKKFESVEEPLKCMAAYPLTEEDYDTKGNITLVYGWMVEYRRHDPNQPIAVPVDDPEGHERALKAALTPYPVSVPFMLAFMETGKYMFDLTLSHVPDGAVIKAANFDEIENAEEISQIDAGVSLSEEIFTPEEDGFLRDISHKTREYAFEHPNSSTEELDAKFVEYAKEITGYGETELEAFLSKLRGSAPQE